MSLLRDELQASLGSAYALERELGGGGMCRVFVAQEVALHRQVVVKVLPPECGAAVSADRFRNEVQLAARLQHPHIVPLLSAGDADGTLFYTMPYVDGESLRDRLARVGRLSIEDALRLTTEMADALAYAHSQGVVHRDIKPANILLSADHALVTDFGIAKALNDATAPSNDRLTSTGIALGTPAYMAPEQALADPHLDHRADIYALGCVAYEMLTGTPPFPGRTSQALVAAHLTETPISVTTSRRDVPPALDAIIAECLAKDPDKRPQSALAIAKRLRATSLAAPYRAFPRVRAAANALLVLTAVLGLGLLGWIGQRLVRSRGAGDPAMPLIAVLPFENRGQAADEFFAEGLTDELTSRLATVPGLRVISRTSARHYNNSNKSLRDIGRELGADYVLEGAVRWEHEPSQPGRLRITPELIRVKDDTHAWADRLNAQATDVFAVQADIAERVVKALDVALSADVAMGLADKPTQDFGAYTAFLRGQHSLNELSAQGERDAVAALEEALSKDSTFGLAHLALASALRNLGSFEGRPSEHEDRAAREFALAERFAPNAAEVRLAIGNRLGARGDTTGALAQFSWAQSHFPSNAEVWLAIGRFHIEHGQWSAAERDLRSAMRLDPNSGTAAFNLAEVYWWTRDLESARVYSDRATALNFPWAGYERALIEGSLAGRWDTAQKLAREVGTGGELLPGFPFSLLDSAGVVATTHRTLSGAIPDSVAYYLIEARCFVRLHNDGRARSYADSARRILELRIRMVPRPDVPNDVTELANRYADLGTILAILGKGQQAIGAAHRAVELQPVQTESETGPLMIRHLAEVYAMVGEPDRAVDQLEYLLSIPSPVARAGLSGDPSWVPLHGNPRFQRLAR